MRFPVDTPYQITVPFGWVKGYPLHLDGVAGAPPKPGPGYGFHTGVDFVTQNRQVYLTEFANIQCIPNNGADGNAIYYSKNGFQVAFCHLQNFAVQSGIHAEGTFLGLMGQSGAADGIHLHFAVKVNGIFVDPMKLITQEEAMNGGDRKNVWNDLHDKDPGKVELEVMKDWNVTYYKLIQPRVKEFKKKIADQAKEIEVLKAQLGTIPTKLEPGIYQVGG